MFPDESWPRRFDKAGRYEYHCGPHPEMKGSIVVE
jgi:plastocyanin